MPAYTTPGVYVEEISTLPPSVAQVATAVPAFIGYTKKVPGNVPIRISSMVEFLDIFGGGYPATFDVEVVTDAGTRVSTVTSIDRISDDFFHLYYCIRHFYDNGGGNCYVVSLGDFNSRAAASDPKQDFKDALDKIQKVDEPTLLVFPDALFLNSDQYYEVADHALQQCAKLMDRFTLVDIHAGDGSPSLADIEEELKTGTVFRRKMTMNNLKYGAAYTPYLNTAYSHGYDASGVRINEILLNEKGSTELIIANGVKIEVIYPVPSAMITTPTATAKLTIDLNATTPTAASIAISAANELEITVMPYTAATPGGTPATGNTLKDISDFWDNMSKTDQKGFVLHFIGNMATWIENSIPEKNLDFPGKLTNKELNSSDVEKELSGLHNLIKAKLRNQLITLPPSAAMAGIYSQVDGTRGVWKAPANVSVSAVTGPSVVIDNNLQNALNVDPTSGKSINVIRSFTGKGTLVWGARTLDGNSNEWRYINVRRLFITIEESVQKASAFAVFEPNDATTWLKVKAMIDNYLYGLWQQGALAGPKPESAYYVHVGLGKTMTTQDILEGRMNIEIGIAAVRPAEFIILKFSHKMQEA